MDKVVLNHMYYKLAEDTVLYKNASNFNYAYSEISQLRNYIGLPEIEPSRFPVYIEMASRKPPENILAVYSVQDVRDRITLLKSGVIYRNRERYRQLQSLLDETKQRIVTAAGAALTLSSNDDGELDMVLEPLMQSIINNTNSLLEENRYEERNDFAQWFTDLPEVINIMSAKITANQAVTIVEFGWDLAYQIEYQIVLAANLAIGGGSDRSIVGYLGDLQQFYEDVSADLPDEETLYVDGNYIDKLTAVENDIQTLTEYIGELTTGLQNLDSLPKLIGPNKIYGISDADSCNTEE